MKRKINWDAVGATTSIVCAIHCAILPLVLTSLPILGMNLVDNKWFEYVMIGLAFVVGMVALAKGRRHYKSRLPMIFFSIGIVFLVLKEIFHQWHNLLLLPAIFFILFAHYRNFKMLESNVKATH